MEDSNIKADYILDSYDLQSIDIKSVGEIETIYDLEEILKKKITWNYGDLISFSDYRDTSTYFIGKEGKIIMNPDYSDSGYLTVPYEITQWLDDAVGKYSEIDPMFIDLNYNDKFIQENINYSTYKLPKKLNLEFTYYFPEMTMIIKFPNNKKHEFNVTNISAYKIMKWYNNSNLEQSIIKIFIKIKGDKYDEFQQKYGENKYIPKLPITWSINSGSGGGGYKEWYSNYTLTGPKKEVNKVTNLIKSYYEGFNYSIKDI